MPERAQTRAEMAAPVQSSRKSSVTARVRGKRFVEHYALPPDWWQISGVLLAAALALAVYDRAMPSVLSAMLSVAGMLGCLLSLKTAQYERKEQLAAQLSQQLVAASVALPMVLFGAGMGLWHLPGAEGTHSSMALLLCISVVASILCNGRMFALVCGNFGLWIGYSAVTLDPILFVAIAVAGAIGFRASGVQNAVNRENQRQQEAVERAQQRAEMILGDYEQTRQGWFWETDRRGVITYVSPTVGEVIGRDTAELLGLPFTDLFNLKDQSREGERTLAFHLSTRSSFQELAVRADTKYDEDRWWSINGLPVYDDFDNFQGFRGSGSDLTERRRSEEKVTRLAHYDSLTGLANRLQISQTLEKVLTARNLEQRTCAVFLIDLDRFKQVNDTLGHPAGDALLTQVSQRLERVIDKFGQVGRLGGDEFQIVIPGVHKHDVLAEMATRVIAALSQPYLIDGHRVVIGASVGIACAPENGVTAEALIRNADLALYAAKDGGRGRHHFYAADLHSDAEERRQLEQDLRDAIASGGLELYYQPVVSTTTEKITGFEALLRWHHPVRGPLSPAKFIPIAEDAGLIAQIGEWALRTACMDMAKWPENVRVAVNVSPLQFANPALPSIVTSALASAQVAPERLELEITESVFLNDSEGTDVMFAALDRIGVRLALDDFGTGYSSLGYLKKAPFDKIKIDQSFVRGATISGSRNGAIIAAIVSLAEALGMETTAEGVETLDELDLIRALGCSHVQGYIYAKPLTVSDARALLARGLSVSADGPRSARPVRQTMLRKIWLEHSGEKYEATIRNISQTGALVTGLWNVPGGTIFSLELGVGQTVTVTTRWCKEDRMGIEFSRPLDLDENGRIVLMPEQKRIPADGLWLRKAG
jgi:diguanylate cyclase (GGDEF)-like protein/PAS domain S-box-containing protein